MSRHERRPQPRVQAAHRPYESFLGGSIHPVGFTGASTEPNSGFHAVCSVVRAARPCVRRVADEQINSRGQMHVGAVRAGTGLP